MKRSIVLVLVPAFVLALQTPWTTQVLAQTGGGLVDQGVGMYTDPSVAEQASTFTLNRLMVTCGVGTVLGPSAGSIGAIGPFEMLMYSLSVDTYTVQHQVPRKIIATGKMRSTTRVGGVIVEDTDGSGSNPPPHDFIAVGEDKDFPQKDHYSIHFKTTFWKPGNPMCAASDLFPGLCRFGGDLFMGNIVVSHEAQIF